MSKSWWWVPVAAMSVIAAGLGGAFGSEATQKQYLTEFRQFREQYQQDLSIMRRLDRIEERQTNHENKNKHAGALGIDEFRESHREIILKLDEIIDK